MQQRTSGTADSDSIAFEISDIDPKALLKPQARPAPPPEPKRPELRVVQTDRLPKLEIPLEPDPIPELISDDSPPAELPQIDSHDEPVAEEETAEVEAIADPESDMNVEPEYVDEIGASQRSVPASSSSTARSTSCTCSSWSSSRAAAARAATKCWCATRMPTTNSAWRRSASCRTCTTRAPIPISTASWSSSW